MADGWILCERDPEIKVIGIFKTQDQAENATIDGRYVIIPFDAGVLYEDLVSEGAVGAIFFTAEGLKTNVEQLLMDVAQINNKINQIIPAVQALQVDVQDLVDRVTALETP